MYDPKKFGAFIDGIEEKTEFAPDNFESIITQIKLEDPDKWNKLSKEIPSGRMAKINDFDGMIIYLLSDLSEHVNGSLISIDGGRAIY